MIGGVTIAEPNIAAVGNRLREAGRDGVDSKYTRRRAVSVLFTRVEVTRRFLATSS